MDLLVYLMKFSELLVSFFTLYFIYTLVTALKAPFFGHKRWNENINSKTKGDITFSFGTKFSTKYIRIKGSSINYA